MTEPVQPDMRELATPYALHAVSETERAQIEQWLATAAPDAVASFLDEVRAVRETMAVVSASTAVEPPQQLRERLLEAVSPGPSDAVVRPLRPAPTPSTAEQVFAASDVRTVSGDIPTGGTATLVFSRERNAGVLVMNNVTPPEPGTVYQMWLIDSAGSHSAGTMNAQAVAPSTTAVLPDLGDSQTLAFTVEPGEGSQQPTTPPFAALPLT